MNKPASPRNVQFDGSIREQISILNEVFRDLDVSEIFDNADIIFDDYLVLSHYLKFNLSRSNNNSVGLDFHLMPDGMQIDLEGYQEACEFSEKFIADKQSTVKKTISRLISGHIMVEFKGSALFVNIFNEDGSRFAIWSLGSFAALFMRGYWKPQEIRQHLFSPIYPKVLK